MHLFGVALLYRDRAGSDPSNSYYGDILVQWWAFSRFLCSIRGSGADGCDRTAGRFDACYGLLPVVRVSRLFATSQCGVCTGGDVCAFFVALTALVVSDCISLAATTRCSTDGCFTSSAGPSWVSHHRIWTSPWNLWSGLHPYVSLDVSPGSYSLIGWVVLPA